MRSKIADGSIDAVITSPPYDELREYENESTWSFEIFQDIAKELYRVVKDGGVVVWIVGDQTKNGSESGTSFRQALYFMDVGFRLHDTMIYEKAGMAFPDKRRYNAVFEYMFIFSKGKPKTINLIKDKKNSWAGHGVARERGDRQKDGRVSPNSAFKNNRDKEVQKLGVRNNIWRYSTGYLCTTKDDYAFEHPAMFPETLAKDHIVSWTNPGDIVLDPFAGAGTTGKCCAQLGRKSISIEIAEKYHAIAAKRIKAAYSQSVMF
jgi:site-specific DNA-methyltransferase (adenine-specific)